MSEDYGLQLMAKGFAEKERILFANIAAAQDKAEEWEQKFEQACRTIGLREEELRSIKMKNVHLKKKLARHEANT